MWLIGINGCCDIGATFFPHATFLIPRQSIEIVRINRNIIFLCPNLWHFYVAQDICVIMA